MTVAVIVIAAGRRSHLVNTISAISAQTAPPDDLVVVDMCPEHPVADIVELPARWVGLPNSGDGLPLAAARNAGAATALGDLLIFLDIDCIAAPNLVERYAEVLADHPDALACGPVRYLKPAWDRDSGDAEPWRTPPTLDAVSDPNPARTPPRGQRVRIGNDHELFWSLSFGCTRATWNTVGGFDEGFRGYGAEDTDFAFRARSLGVPLTWFQGGTAYHQWHAPTRHDDAHLPSIVANAQRFHDRWAIWPMSGWLEELHRRERVVFDPSSDRLELVPRR